MHFAPMTPTAAMRPSAWLIKGPVRRVTCSSDAAIVIGRAEIDHDGLGCEAAAKISRNSVEIRVDNDSLGIKRIGSTAVYTRVSRGAEWAPLEAGSTVVLGAGCDFALTWRDEPKTRFSVEAPLRPVPAPVPVPEQVPMPAQPAQKPSTLLMVLGWQGAGKTTLVKQLIDSATDWSSIQGGTANREDASRLQRPGAVVFGKWQGFQPDGSSTKAGRLDGCDRLEGPSGELEQCKRAVARLAPAGVRLFVTDGVALLNRPFVDAARHAGLRVRLVELDVPADVAAARQQARDGPNGRACDWAAKREKWRGDPGWESMQPAALLRTLQTLLVESNGAGSPADDEADGAEAAAAADAIAEDPAAAAREVATRQTSGAYPTMGRRCNHDGTCWQRGCDHWLRYTHPCELEKPYCPRLLSHGFCYNVGRHAHNAQYSHGPLPSAMLAHSALGRAPAVAPSQSSFASSSSTALGALKQQLHSFLWQHRAELFASQHRTGLKFALVGSFMVGEGTTNNLFLGRVSQGHPSFIKHPTRNVGVYVPTVDMQLARGKVSRVQWQAYQLAKRALECFDRHYSEGEFVVQFAYMNDGHSHYVKKHKDTNDVSFQYVLGLGDYTGAVLRVHNQTESAHRDFDVRNRVLKFDGRCSHELILDGFRGDRFTVIYYKNYDNRLGQQDAPIFDAPCFVD